MSAPASSRPDRIRLGIVVMVGTALTMAFGDALVKRISADFSIWQIYVLRSLVAIPLTVVLLRVRSRSLEIMPQSIGWALLRSALLVAMWVAFYAALPVLSLSTVAAAYYTGPLFITLFSALLTGEPVGVRRWVAIVVGFVGVLVILRPGTEAFSWLTILPVLSAVLYALAAVVTRAKCASENPLALSLALNLCFLAAGAIGSALIVIRGATPEGAAYPFLLGAWSSMGVHQWALIAVMACLIVATSAGVAKAYQSGPSSIIATFDYSYLVFAVLWSFVFFSELPDPATAIGMLLIAGAGLLAIARPGATRGTGAANRLPRSSVA
jgi:drug/metabolite transporter (DMT)-like permease